MEDYMDDYYESCVADREDDGPEVDLDDDTGIDEVPVREDFGWFGDENLCGE